jgi:hypothetical protein
MSDGAANTATLATTDAARTPSCEVCEQDTVSCNYAHDTPAGNRRRANSFQNIRPLVVCGASGAGKGTLLKAAYTRFPGKVSVCCIHFRVCRAVQRRTLL